MQKHYLLGLMSLLLLSCQPPQAPVNTLEALVADYWNKQLATRPDLSVKYEQPLEEIRPFSEETNQQDAAWATSFLERLQEVDTTGMAHEDLLSYLLLEKKASNLLEFSRFFHLQFPVTPYASPFRELNQFFGLLPITTQEAATQYLKLGKDYVQLVRSIQNHLEWQMAQGIVLPEPEIQLVMPYLKSLIRSPENHPLMVSQERLGSLSAEAQTQFRDELTKLLSEELNPALEQLLAFVSGDYLSKAGSTVGLYQYPDGEAYYRFLIRYHTSQELEPEDIHRIGLAEVDRINQEMAKIREEIGFSGDKAAFMEFLRTDKRFFPETPEAVGQLLMSHNDRILPLIDRYFNAMPKAPFGVKRLDPSLEASMTFGYYEVPTPQNDTGFYRFNGSGLDQRPLVNAAALTYHELIPGHHFQFNLQNENTALPLFRREDHFTAYSEGWGEYASGLADEIGLLEDPYDRYGRLLMDMFLSVRLVVDSGMNHLKWTREEAMEFMRQNIIESEVQLATETLRYSSDLPGQALAYKTGSLKLLQLREKAKKALGDLFDIRRFHDALLQTGSMPLDIVEEHINWFIEQEKTQLLQ